MLSDARADSPATTPIPAVAERSSASRRVRMRFEDSDMNGSPLLLRQCILPINVEVSSRNGCCGIGLTSADTDRVIPLRDDGIAILRHHLKIARLQIKMDLLAGARIEMNALKATQSDMRRTLDRRKREIELLAAEVAVGPVRHPVIFEVR